MGWTRLRFLPEPLPGPVPSALLGNMLVPQGNQEGNCGGLCSRKMESTGLPHSSLNPLDAAQSTCETLTVGGTQTQHPGA